MHTAQNELIVFSLQCFCYCYCGCCMCLALDFTRESLVCLFVGKTRFFSPLLVWQFIFFIYTKSRIHIFYLLWMLTTIFVHRIFWCFFFRCAFSVFGSRVLFSLILFHFIWKLCCFYIAGYCFIFLVIALKLTFSSVDSVMVRFLCKYPNVSKVCCWMVCSVLFCFFFLISLLSRFNVVAVHGVFALPFFGRRRATATHFTVFSALLTIYSLCCCCCCFFIPVRNIVFIHCVCVLYLIVFLCVSLNCTFYLCVIA